MVRINLLPHREQKRQARQRQFVSLIVGLAVLGLAVVGLGHVIIAQRIDNQNGRNKLLKDEIVKLDETGAYRWLTYSLTDHLAQGALDPAAP